MVVVVGAVVGAFVVVGGVVVGIGLAWSGANLHSSNNLNSTESNATKPLALFFLCTTHWIWD